MLKLDIKNFENIRERLTQAKKERQEKAKAVLMKYGFYERHLAFIERLKENNDSKLKETEK
jgi:hypothetical protein